MKYKPAYICDYDKDIAPKLMTGGRRLPLDQAGPVPLVVLLGLWTNWPGLTLSDGLDLPSRRKLVFWVIYNDNK
jgi:hypothetical protein